MANILNPENRIVYEKYKHIHEIITAQDTNSTKEEPIIKAIYTDKGMCRFSFGRTTEDMTNYQVVADWFGVDVSRMIRVKQTHSSSVLAVDDKYAGEGIIKECSFEGYDGMVTNVRNLVLCTVEADCVPVYMYDPVQKVIAMVHSGWRGTKGLIANDAIKVMKTQYGSNPADIRIALGPCICKKCYEVGPELIEEFKENYSEAETETFFTKRNDGKYDLDIPKAIEIAVTKEGILAEHFASSPLCTYENTDYCSWRREKNPDDRMLTAICLQSRNSAT